MYCDQKLQHCAAAKTTQESAILLAYRHSSAQLNKAHEALKAASVPSVGGHIYDGCHESTQSVPRNTFPVAGDVTSSQLKRSRVCMKPQQGCQSTSLPSEEKPADSSLAQVDSLPTCY